MKMGCARIPLSSIEVGISSPVSTDDVTYSDKLQFRVETMISQGLIQCLDGIQQFSNDAFIDLSSNIVTYTISVFFNNYSTF